MMSLDGLLGFAKASRLSAVTYDVTYFPHADDVEVAYQLAGARPGDQRRGHPRRVRGRDPGVPGPRREARRRPARPQHRGGLHGRHRVRLVRHERLPAPQASASSERPPASSCAPARPRWICSTSTDRLLRLNLRVALRPVTEHAARPQLCVSRSILGGARLLQNGLHAVSGQGSHDGSNAYKRLQVYLVLPFLRYDNLRLRRFPTIERGFFWSTRYADSLRVLLTKLLIS